MVLIFLLHHKAPGGCAVYTVNFFLSLQTFYLRTESNKLIWDVQKVMEVIDKTLALTSRDIQSAGLVLLTALFSSLVGIYPKLDRQSFEERIMGNGLHCWMSKYPENFAPPK